ncbi:hypothetical protein WR25_21395 [Diploscapter pachys]|uniref:PDZ domain-containing protein n=1 Tax=Diploscapter pachys TaxID=2018661 RepID=A0A2A2JCW1_9BILA|nr:hypothetical protein WR25_21395 [Diploscapter pachys]
MTAGNRKEEVMFVTSKINAGVDLKDGVVICVLPSSRLLGCLFVGDKINSVNGVTNIRTTADFLKAATSKLPGKVTIDLTREEALLPTTPGTEMFEMTLKWKSGGNTGLLIHDDVSGRVAVAVIETGSTVSRVIRPGDILLKVNQIDAKDKETVKALINKSVAMMHQVTLTIERHPGVQTSAIVQKEDVKKMDLNPKINKSARDSDLIYSDGQKYWIVSMSGRV